MSFKAIVFLLLTLALAAVATAQITISQGSIAPVGSSYTDYPGDNEVTISPGPAGANQTWTIPEQTFTAPAPFSIIAPASTPYADRYPGATHAISDGSGYYAYTRVTSSGMYIMGFIVAADTFLIETIYDPQGLLAPLPLSYPHADWTYLTRMTMEPFPGFVLTTTDSTLCVLDAWGTINTQFGSFQALRVRRHQYLISQFTGLPPNVTETTAYTWVTTSGQFVVSMNNSDGWDPNFTSAFVSMQIPGTTAVDPVRGPVAKQFSVEQNYPNPFNPSTTLPVELSQSGEVTLRIYNENGQLVSEQTELLSAGAHQLPINAGNWASGNYFATVAQNNASETVKMQLIK